MPDYKKLYFELFRANATAAQQLLDAQLRAEEAVMWESDPPIALRQIEKNQPSQHGESAGVSSEVGGNYKE